MLNVLRDLRRRFQVDSDRVFLTGQGEGGNMAYNVGLSHPDLFAGVMPISGQPQFFAVSYWRNAQYLPFYVVNGDHAGDLSKHNREQFFDKWIPRGFPALHAEYKGRGLEGFEGELPFLFAWMEHKVRSHAPTELGLNGNGTTLGQEFQNPAPDRQPLLLDQHRRDCRQLHRDVQNWGKRAVPAALDAHIFGESNQVNINVRNFKQLTVWLTPEGTGLDLTKPLTIRVNGTALWNKRLEPPSMATLLEDFYLRGDRQWLFLAKVDLDRL